MQNWFGMQVWCCPTHTKKPLENVPLCAGQEFTLGAIPVHPSVLTDKLTHHSGQVWLGCAAVCTTVYTFLLLVLETLWICTFNKSLARFCSRSQSSSGTLCRIWCWSDCHESLSLPPAETNKGIKQMSRLPFQQSRSPESSPYQLPAVECWIRTRGRGTRCFPASQATLSQTNARTEAVVAVGFELAALDG